MSATRGNKYAEKTIKINVQIQVRGTEEEVDSWRRSAEGSSFNSWCREQLNKGVTTSKKDRIVPADVRGENSNSVEKSKREILVESPQNEEEEIVLADEDEVDFDDEPLENIITNPYNLNNKEKEFMDKCDCEESMILKLQRPKGHSEYHVLQSLQKKLYDAGIREEG